jgi:uncharacterized Zn-binding protein involved in type VI secretion
MGDMTVHGGNIVAGCPTVLIGGKPAARVGDMHVCPMQTPAPAPIPHVGMPILPPGAVTVLIGGQPAACVGDMAACTGPPDSIAPPGEPTVLIGPGGGGGGGGGRSGSSSGQAEGESGGEAQSAAELEDEGEDHFLHVDFVDQGGFPVMGVAYSLKKSGSDVDEGVLTGRVHKTGLEAGSYDIELRVISKAEWSKTKAAVGDKVQMTAECSGIENGTEAILRIFLRDLNAPDREIKVIDTKVDGNKIKGEWTFEMQEDLLPTQPEPGERPRLSYPKYYFVASAAGCTARSRILEFKDTLELRFVDDEGNPIANAPFKVYCAHGIVKTGTLDSNGEATVEDIPPGRVRVSLFR